MTHLVEEEIFTAAEVATVIKGMKSGKAADEEVESADWRNSLVNASASRLELRQNKQRLTNRCDYSDIQERRSQAMYELQKDITPQFARKSICQYFERKCGEIVKSNGQCGFRPSHSTTDQIFEKSWEYGKNLFACFVNLEKAYDRVPRDI